MNNKDNHKIFGLYNESSHAIESDILNIRGNKYREIGDNKWERVDAYGGPREVTSDEYFDIMQATRPDDYDKHHSKGAAMQRQAKQSADTKRRKRDERLSDIEKIRAIQMAGDADYNMPFEEGSEDNRDALLAHAVNMYQQHGAEPREIQRTLMALATRQDDPEGTHKVARYLQGEFLTDLEQKLDEIDDEMFRERSTNRSFEETNHATDDAALAPGDKRQKDGSVTDKTGKVVYKPKPRHPKGGVPYSDGKGEHDPKHIDKMPSEVKEGTKGTKADREKADVNDDGDLEGWEKAKANAIRHAQGKKHLCAKTVVHEQHGPGAAVHAHHALPDVNGNIEWYMVEFKHGIEKVYTESLDIITEEEH